MMIDSADLIRKLPMMIQCTKTFAKFSEGGDYHIGEVDKWCLNYKEIVKGIPEIIEELQGLYELAKGQDDGTVDFV